MKMNHICGLLALSVAAVSLASCADQLDIAQHGAVTIETYYETDEQALSANANIYQSLSGTGWNDRLRSLLHLFSDDVYSGGASRSDAGEKSGYNEFFYTSESEYLEKAFVNLYQTVYACNVLLANVDDSSQAKKQYRAEAQVARAMTYIYLTQLWGTPPLVDHCLAESEYNTGNSTKEELWAFVEKDLNEAINSGALVSKDDKYTPRADRRITLEYAIALLGKAQVFQEKWDEAAATFDRFFARDKYELWQGEEFRDLFYPENELNCEFIFQINQVNDPSRPFSFATWNTYPNACSWRSTNINNQPYGAPGMGFGNFTPRKEIYDAFLANEGADGYRLTSSIITTDQIQQRWPDMEMNIDGTFTDKYFLWKCPYTQERDMCGMGITHRDFVMMRYAEVLLLAAEANQRCGKQAKADECINKIRQRAKLAPKSNVTMEDIKLEKRCELFLECCRFIDIVRWGDAEKLMSKQGESYPELNRDWSVVMKPTNNTVYGFKYGHHDLLPFPASEIRLNTALTQNPNW